MDTTCAGRSVTELPDFESLCLAAAAIIVAEARRAVKTTGRFTIALSGGDTPKPIYQLLAEPPFAALMPWEATHVFWGDERCVAATDPRSNERMARLALLDHVPIPAAQVHPMTCSEREGGAAGGAALSEHAAHQAAVDYERLLRAFFETRAGGAAPAARAALGPGVDLVLLGMGSDGHTASLFPGSEVLAEREHWTAAAYEDPTTAAATSGSGEQLWRVTMTAPFINRAGLTLFVVSGALKAAVVKATIEGDPDRDPHELPARLIRPVSGRLWWLLDDKAASQLEPSR
jgi:6-phosphogluconolactonase